MSDEPLVVSVNAIDTGAGEGLVADAAVFGELACRAAFVATSALPPEPLPLDVVSRQLERALAVRPIGAVRVGFVHGPPQVEAIAHFLRTASPGASVFAPALRAGAEILVDDRTKDAMARHLYPAARVVVARAAELSSLTGREAEDLSGLRDAAQKLRDRGAQAVVISGWIAHGRVLDLLDDGGEVSLLDTARIHAAHVAGLAGAYAASLAAHLARGLTLRDAAEAAQRYVGFRITRGR